MAHANNGSSNSCLKLVLDARLRIGMVPLNWNSVLLRGPDGWVGSDIGEKQVGVEAVG